MQLWYRALGPFVMTPMFDDGLHGDGAAGDFVFGATIPGLAAGSVVDYYTLARTAALDMTFLPLNADFRAEQYRIAWPVGSSPIKINEFVAQNTTGVQDEASQYEDWVELYNTDTVAVDVGGMWLTDNLVQKKYQIPAGNVIPARGVLHVWCDEDGTQGPLHANFKLSASGEAVGLFAADGLSLVDSITFGDQSANVSTGRLTDGGAAWVTFGAPTARARNEIACGLRGFSGLDPARNRLTLAITGNPQLGTSPSLSIAGGMPSGTAALALAPAGASLDLASLQLSFALLLDPAVGWIGPVNLPLNASGAYSFLLPLPADPFYVGWSLYLQAYAFDTSGLTASNGLQMVICP